MRLLSTLNWLAVCFAVYQEEYIGGFWAFVLGVVAVAACLYDNSKRPVRYPRHAIITRTGFLVLVPLYFFFRWAATATADLFFTGTNAYLVAMLGAGFGLWAWFGYYVLWHGFTDRLVVGGNPLVRQDEIQWAIDSGYHPYWDDLPRLLNPTSGLLPPQESMGG
jgi:hypothetical protein